MLPWWAVSFNSRSAKVFRDTSAYLNDVIKSITCVDFYANQTSVKINDRLWFKEARPFPVALDC